MMRSLYLMESRQFHITRDIKNAKAALQVLPASLRGTFLASIWLKSGIKSAHSPRGTSGINYQKRSSKGLPTDITLDRTPSGPRRPGFG